MTFWSWILRMMIAALAIGLFLLQSQFAKKSILEFIVNQPFKNSTFRVEADGIRGLFPFQFTVASLNLKEGATQLAALSHISATWSLPALMAQQVSVQVTKGTELMGNVVYTMGKHALFANIQGVGLPLPHQWALTSLNVDLPTLNLLKGRVMATLQNGQESATLTLKLEELDEERLKITEIILTGKEITGKGSALVCPKQNAWEGEAEISIASLAPYDQWLPKDLARSGTLKCRKTLKGQGDLDVSLEQFHYKGLEAQSVTARVVMEEDKRFALALQAHEAVLGNTRGAIGSNIPITKLEATGTFAQNKGNFDVSGAGPQNIFFQAQGDFNLAALSAPTAPQVQIILKRAALSHPLHQFSLKEPALFLWEEGNIQASKVWITTEGGMAAIQDLTIGDHLSGILAIDRLPLTLLRLIDPEWFASGHLSGKGKIKGTREQPEVELSLEGKSLRWGMPSKSRHRLAGGILGIDASSVMTLSQGFLAWQVKLVSGRFLSLVSQGKLSVDPWFPTAASSLQATLKGHANMGVISLFMPSEDLIQGQASCDFDIGGIVQNPLIKGQVSITNGLYENAAFGTLLKNISIQGRASGDVLTLSTISGRDNSKGRFNGRGSLKFISLLNPQINLQLTLDQLIVVQNDEISGKASGALSLQGSGGGEKQEQAKITGNIVIQPLEVRLDERDEKIVTIKLLEKKKDGSYQPGVDPHKQAPLQKDAFFLPLDIKLSSPGEIYVRGYGFDAQWGGEMKAIGTITDPQLLGKLTLVQGKLDLLGKPLKLSEGRITYPLEPKNDPILSIVGIREVGEATAAMRIEGHASSPKITFSSTPALPQEEILARLLFGRSLESMSITQSLLLANALNAFKGKNNLNFTEKIRSAFGLDVLEFKERKSSEGDELASVSEQVSVGKQITDKIYLSLDQSVSGDGGTTATIQFDVTPSLKIEADVGGEKNTAVGFAWVKKY